MYREIYANFRNKAKPKREGGGGMGEPVGLAYHRSPVQRFLRYYGSLANLGPAIGLAINVFLAASDAAKAKGEHHVAAAQAATAIIAVLSTLPRPWQTLMWAVPSVSYLLLSTIGARSAWPATVLLALRLIPLLGAFLTLIVLVLAPIAPFPPIQGLYQTIGTVSDVWAYTSSKDGSQRRLPVQIWYPSAKAEPPAHKRTMLWTPGTGTAADVTWFTTLMRSYATVMQFPWFMSPSASSHLMHVTVPAVYKAPLSTDKQKWPVLIFSHGLYGYKSTSSYICMTLAANGFIVVAPDHVGCAIIAQPHVEGIADRHLFSLFKKGFGREPLETQRNVYEAHLHTRHADLLAMARKCLALGQARSSSGSGGVISVDGGAIAPDVVGILSGGLDGSKMGVFGHSYGGGTSVAVTATHGAVRPLSPAGGGSNTPLPGSSPSPASCGSTTTTASEPVIRACVCLDPWLYPVPPAYTTGTLPYSGLTNLAGEELEAVLKQYDASGDFLRDAAKATARRNATAPTLVLSAQGWGWSRLQLPFAHAVAARHRHSHIHLLRHTGHLDMTDMPIFMAPLILRLANSDVKGDPFAANFLIAQLTTAFFQAHLLGEAGGASKGGSSSSSSSSSTTTTVDDMVFPDPADPFKAALLAPTPQAEELRQLLGGHVKHAPGFKL